MNQNDRTIVLRPKGALTVRADPSAGPRRTEIMHAPYMSRWAVECEARQAEERGEVRRLRRNAVWSHERARWEIPIVRLRPARPPAPAWRKPLLVAAAIATPLLALSGALWWLANALSGTALVAFCAVVVAGLGALLFHGREKPSQAGAVAIAIATVVIKK